MGVRFLSTCVVAISLGLTGCADVGRRSFTASDSVLEGSEWQRANVVIAALSQVGTPYVYGAGTPGKAFDCSGLTQYAHSTAGVSIPRVSTAQRAAAVPVKGMKPKPGDLVFFRTGPDQYHVGIMVDDQRFVHASTSDRRVRLARLSDAYWRKHYLGAGTFLD